MKVPSQVLDAEGNCKKCGSPTSCRHEIGGSGCDVAEYFWLVCPNCGDIDRFGHVDMSGNEIETCPWCGRRANEDPPTKTDNQTYAWLVQNDEQQKPQVLMTEWNEIHLITETKAVEDPAGCEAESYKAACGVEFESWSYHGYPMAAFGTKAEAEQTGLKFCEKCF